MPIGWCCPPAIRRQVRSRARKPCRASRRLLLSGHPRAAGLTLANRFQGGDPIDHVDVRHHEIKPDHWPRGGAAPCNARLSRRQVRYLEWLSGLLGLILTGRGRCGTLRRVRHSTQCIKSIGYQRLRGPGTPRQHPFPMRTDLLVRCNSAGQDQCG